MYTADDEKALDCDGKSGISRRTGLSIRVTGRRLDWHDIKEEPSHMS